MPSDIFQVESAIKKGLQLLDNWLNGNDLSLNVAKTNAMHICAIWKRSSDKNGAIMTAYKNRRYFCGKSNKKPSKIKTTKQKRAA